MEPNDPVYQAVLKKEIALISAYPHWEPAYQCVEGILAFLKENGLTTGFTRGAACASVFNHHIGLTHINPTEHGLIPERYFGAGPFFPILLDGRSYGKVQDYLKSHKLDDHALNKLSIDILHEPRLDAISHHGLLSIAELSALVKKLPGAEGSDIDSFSKHCDFIAMERMPEIFDFWTRKAMNTGFLELAERFPPLRPDNYYHLMIYQEEWMRVVQEVLGTGMAEANAYRKSVSKRISDSVRDFELVFTMALAEKYRLNEREALSITGLMTEGVVYLGCKAGWVGEGELGLIQ